MTNIAEALANRKVENPQSTFSISKMAGGYIDKIVHRFNREAAILNSVKSMLTADPPIKFIISADVDKNLATYATVKSEIPGLDPRGVVIDPNAREALRQMHEAGIPIVISTARGAAEVSQYLKIPGTTIIGSQGLEVRKVDDVDYNKGESHIDPRFEPYKDHMNAIMQDVYTRFVAHISGVNPEEVTLPTEPVLEVPINRTGHYEGHVVVQLKGQSKEYPFGIAMAFNVNQPIDGTPEHYISEDNQKKIRDIQADYLTRFNEIFNQALQQHWPEYSQENHADIMSFRTRNESLLYNGVKIPTLDLEIRPGMESGKGYAQLQLMMTDDDPRRAANFKGAPSAPFTYFSGDSVDLRSSHKRGKWRLRKTRWGAGQDWSPMHVGHLTFALSGGRGGVIGIQTLRPGETPPQIPNVDITVDGPAGLGNLLMKMAQVVREYRQNPTA